ncbi:sensor histidine kinase [Gordonia sp. NPDC003950]
MFLRVVRQIGSAAATEIRGLPVVQHPDVRAYLRSPVNWFFLIFAVVLFAVAWPTLPETHDLPSYALPVTAAVATLPLALAWAAPLLGWAVCVIAAQLIGFLVPTANGWPWTIQVTQIIALLVLTFVAYLRCPLRYLAPVWLVSAAAFALAAPPTVRVGWVFGVTSMAVVVALLRGLLSSRRQLAASAEETKAAESVTAVLEERARIARDLHDVVAHRMSMVVVMAQTARYRIPDVGDAAAAEFDAIASAARNSLDEVRQLLGVLRLDGTQASSAPNPGLADIDSLLDHTRLAGASVTVSDTLDHAEFAESSALVIYRIVQESLANATRHAPGATIAVTLVPADDGAEVTVVNAAGTDAPLELGGAGVGITGMSDRARAVGGWLTAHPTRDGGFVVRAYIPAIAGRGVVEAPGRFAAVSG